jgi:hypothetical protein
LTAWPINKSTPPIYGMENIMADDFEAERKQHAFNIAELERQVATL